MIFYMSLRIWFVTYSFLIPTYWILKKCNKICVGIRSIVLPKNVNTNRIATYRRIAMKAACAMWDNATVKKVSYIEQFVETLMVILINDTYIILLFTSIDCNYGLECKHGFCQDRPCRNRKKKCGEGACESNEQCYDKPNNCFCFPRRCRYFR